MGNKTGIDWTQKTWNPTTGCTKVNECCELCYAETWSLDLQTRGMPKYRNGFKLTLHEQEIDKPLHWKQPAMIFVNSMSDLFHKDIPYDFIKKCFDVMFEADWHIYQILTKRPALMRNFIEWYMENCWYRTGMLDYIPKHIWLGVSVGMKSHLTMIDQLRMLPAVIRFVSFEPLLEDLGKLNLDAIQWAIIGGESGQGHRPMKEEWAVNIIEQCQAKNVSLFFKQWGGPTSKSRSPEGQPHNVIRGRTYQEYPLTLKNLRQEVLL